MMTLPFTMRGAIVTEYGRFGGKVWVSQTSVPLSASTAMRRPSMAGM